MYTATGRTVKTGCSRPAKVLWAASAAMARASAAPAMATRRMVLGPT